MMLAREHSYIFLCSLARALGRHDFPLNDDHSPQTRFIGLRGIKRGHVVTSKRYAPEESLRR